MCSALVIYHITPQCSSIHDGPHVDIYIPMDIVVSDTNV